MSLLLMDGLLLVPLIMAAFFYPIEEVLAFIGAVAVLTLVAYDGYVIWRKRHARTTP